MQSIRRFLSKGVFGLLIALFSCKNNTLDSSFAFTLLDAKDSGIDFINAVEDQENFNILTYRNYYNGGGVAIGDINNDGLSDIYFTANMADNKLYLNKGQMKFEDITTKAGVIGKKSWCTGVTMADVNADGWLDIYVCYSGDAAKENKENELYINNHNNTFTERAKEYGLNDAGLSTHAAFFDYDLDGDLDCYVLNNSYKNPEKISLIPRDQFDSSAIGGDRLYRNDSPPPTKEGIKNPKFVNVTKEAGIYSNNVGFGLGISVGDVNGDLYPDIYISNDFWERDYLYINQKNGKFLEKLPEMMSYTSLASMGSDIADINNDGHLDIFSTDMLPPDNQRLKAATKFEDYYLYDLKVRQNYHYQYMQNCLQINQGDGSFVESSFLANVAATDWSWGALIFDMNLDGNKDLFVSNGVYHDITDSDFIDFIADQEQVKKIVSEKSKYDFRDFVKFLPPNKRRNYAFLNKGNLSFSNEAASLNLNQESFSNGSAYSDLDNDGDLDLVVNNVNMSAFVYQNNSTANKQQHFIKLNFKGQQGNLFGIGATVFVYQKGQMQMAQNLTARGFQSSVAPSMTFGFGQNPQIDSLRVVWPDFQTELIKNPKADQTLFLDYTKATTQFNPTIRAATPLFEENTIANAVHVENNYIDYDSDRLLPHVLSTEGPKLIKGDVNQDGKQDFILQGARGMADKLFLNSGIGFTESKQPDFEANKDTESISGALFDADKDGDLDYLVGLGGNEYRMGVQSFVALFYENDGQGNFKKNQAVAPKIMGQIGCIKPFDFDNDGDLDLFVGGKAIPGSYGLTPRSYLLKNEGSGIWDDVTNEFTGPIGMVTDAVWTDINNDKLVDLVVVGEWMPITVFVNDRGQFGKPLQVPSSEGWWNTIEVADIDQDGDNDYLLGNWGMNIKLKASVEKPLNLYVQDFDDNKRPDVILEWYAPEDTKPYPFASKTDLTAQMPILKKKILKYQDFAKMQVADLFDSDKLSKATKKSVVNFSSSVLLNQNGNLILENLPLQAQLSPIFAFEVDDFDHDGITDFFAGGNFYRLKPEMGKHDGFYGGYFKGLGKGKFTFVQPQATGFYVRGEIRDAITIDNHLIISRNNASVLSFSKKEKSSTQLSHNK
ncbi:MAG: VCBS repeat-containing protein [Spirosomataceae bacterium]